MFPWVDLGPIKVSLSVPPAMIVYVTPHSSPLIVTVAIPLVIGALPKLYTHNYVTNFVKRVLYMHSFKSHFSPPFNKYNNRLIIHVYSIAKNSMVFFYS